MAISAQELNIILTARDKQFQKAMTAAEKKVGEFSKNSQKNLSNTSKSFSALGTAAKRLGPALIAAFSVRALANIANSAVELGNLAVIAGVSVERFQELAFVGAAFGVSQEKMADILKDVNEKFGDYLTTGAGPLDDFFENIAPKIGLTAKAFEGLSSDQKMGKYVQALQAANLSQERMTFFMEALASDSTLLLRAFADNGAEVDRLSKKLRDAGGVISSEMIEKSRTAQEELRLVSEVLSKNLNAGLELVLPLITRLTRDFDDLTTAAGEYFKIDKGISGSTVSKALMVQLGQITEINGKISDLEHSMTTSTEKSSGERIAFLKTQAAALQAEIDAKFLYLDSLKPGNEANLPPPVVVAADKPAGPDKKTRDAAAEADAERRAALLAGNLKVLQDYTDALIAAEEASADMNDEELSRLENIQSAYESVRGSLDPLYAATQQYAEAIQEVNAALAEGFISEDQAAKDRAELLSVFETAKAEASEFAGIMDTVGDSFGTAFGEIVTGSASAADAFKRMAATIITELIRMDLQAAKSGGSSILLGLGKSLFGALLGGLGGGGGGYTGNVAGGVLPGFTAPMAKGGAFSNGNIIPFAKGGVVNSPTLFPMAKGAGLMGEAGPEAVMPLSRGANGKLGVSASGGAGAVVNIYNQTDGQVETKQDGNNIEVMIRAAKSAVSADIGNGGQVYKAISQRFTAQTRTTRR